MVVCLSGGLARPDNHAAVDSSPRRCGHYSRLFCSSSQIIRTGQIKVRRGSCGEVVGSLYPTNRDVKA